MKQQQAHFDIGVYAKDKGVDYLFGVGALSESALSGFAGEGKISSDLDELATAVKANAESTGEGFD